MSYKRGDFTAGVRLVLREVPPATDLQVGATGTSQGEDHEWGSTNFLVRVAWDGVEGTDGELPLAGVPYLPRCIHPARLGVLL